MNIDHLVFKRGELCPVTKLFGIPLLIYSAAVERGIDMPGQGNQPAVYLRIEPHDGFAPPPSAFCFSAQPPSLLIPSQLADVPTWICTFLWVSVDIDFSHFTCSASLFAETKNLC